MRSRGVSPVRVRAAGRVRFPLLPYELILGTSIKVQHNLDVGMLTRIVYLAPERESIPYGGKNLCPWATTCPDVCLGDRGRLFMDSGRNSKAWKTLTFLHAREAFRAILFRALATHERRAETLAFDCGARLNGSSDIVWESILPEVFSTFPRIQFYDYTKSIGRMFVTGPENYHLTFSYSGQNLQDCLRVLRSGQNVAIVFKNLARALARGHWYGFPLLNGDLHDCRPTDRKGHWVALSPKGHAKDETGFFV